MNAIKTTILMAILTLIPVFVGAGGGIMKHFSTHPPME
jgi:hypothetical protein